jgi:hypothetical protein
VKVAAGAAGGTAGFCCAHRLSPGSSKKTQATARQLGNFAVKEKT